MIRNNNLGFSSFVLRRKIITFLRNFERDSGKHVFVAVGKSLKKIMRSYETSNIQEQ